MTATPKITSMQSFALGMDNRAPDYKLRSDKGYFLRDASNVDVTATGSVKRRRGSTITGLTGSDVHSLWSSQNGSFYVNGIQLYSITDTTGGLTSTPVTSVQRSSRISYTDAPEGGVYWTDGYQLQRFVGGSSAPVTPLLPSAMPTISVVPASSAADGALRTGLYAVVFTAIDGQGRESAPSHPIQIDVPDGWVIRLSFSLSGANQVAAYVTDEGGTVPFFVGVFTGADIVVGYQPEGRACLTYGMQPMPAGSIVRSFNGRLIVANSNILFFSEPFAPGIYKAELGFFQFPTEITVVEPIQGEQAGLYVVADSTYWLSGDFTKANLLTVLPYGAIKGTSVSRADRTACHWMSVRGMISAGPGGTVQNIQEEHVAVSTASSGATLLRDTNGVKQAVASLFPPTTYQLASASSYMDAEII